MTDTIHRQAEAYRRRAEEARTKADDTHDENCREALFRLANGYDRLADNLDRVAERHRDENDATGT
jgi:hypothetical protein